MDRICQSCIPHLDSRCGGTFCIDKNCNCIRCHGGKN